MTEKRLHILETLPVPQAILHLAIPTILGMLVQIFYNMTDTFFVGKLNDANQVAAIAITMPIFMMLLAMSSVFANGGASYLSRLLGRKDYETAQQTIATAWFSCLVFGLSISALGLFGIPTILTLSGASVHSAPFAASYLRIIMAGSVIMMLNFTAGQLLRAEGAAKEAMFGMVLGTVVNIILDPLFILTLHHGVAGAAVATIIGNAVGLAYYISYYARRKSLVPLSFKHISLRKTMYVEMISVGMPISLNQALISLSNAFINKMASGYGDVAVAAMGIDMRILMIPILLSVGLAIGAQPLIGYSYGAGNMPRLKSSVKVAGAMATGVVGFFTIIFVLFPSQLVKIFIQDPAVIATGTTILYAMVIGLPFIGLQVVIMNTLQAMGKGFPALLVSLSRQGLVFVPSILILNALFGFSGFIYAQGVADILTLIIAVSLFWRVLAKDDRAHEPKPQQSALPLRAAYSEN